MLSSVSYGAAVNPAVGTDLTPILGLSAAAGASSPVAGIPAETPLQCAGALVNQSNKWYSLAFAASVPIADADAEAVAEYIEAVSPSRIFGLNIGTTTVLDGTREDDVGSVLQSLNLSRTLSIFSTSSPFAICSLLGRIATVDFKGSNTTITAMFKQLPGIAAEALTENQAAALKAKNVNVFAGYENSTAIVQWGTMADGSYIDERQGLDWLQNDIQVGCYNLFYTSATKVPQTDKGMAQLANRIGQSLDRGVTNGLIAPGVWNYSGFGTLSQGDMLESGWYIFTPLVATQSQADREARHSVPFQIAIKGAGAVHDMTAAAQFNR